MLNMTNILQIIYVEFDLYAFGLWQLVPKPEYPTGYTKRVVSVSTGILPEDICYRAENWNHWLTIEMSRQEFWRKQVIIDADGFNRVGREIAKSVKLFFGNEYQVQYIPIEKTGYNDYAQAEIIS
jgi:hypothetical protein